MKNSGGLLFSTNAPGGYGASGSRGHYPGRYHELRSLRILVADDDRDSVLTLMMLLRDEGHDVRGVYSGRNVMGGVIDFDPDAVLLDIAMPGLSGWEVARTIRSQPVHERRMLIGISGEYKQGADKILSEIIGFDHYLVKPYEPADLIALLAPLRDPNRG